VHAASLVTSRANDASSPDDVTLADHVPCGAT